MYFDHARSSKAERNLKILYNELPSKVEEWFRGQKWIEDWLPAWVTELHFGFSSNKKEDGTCIQSKVDYNYRLVQFVVFSDWLTLEDDLQKQSLIHEVVHVLIGPMQCWMEDLLGHVLRDYEGGKEWMSKMIQHEFDSRLEQVVCDITAAMEKQDERT